MSALDDLITDLANLPEVYAGKVDLGQLVGALSEQDIDSLFEAMVHAQSQQGHKLINLFPDEGPFRRELYKKHLLFFKLGKTQISRCFLAANRVGKSTCGAYEGACHATGMYPHWWEGRVFPFPTNGLAAGDTNETTRDIIQKELFGKVVFDGNTKGFDGSGMVPKELMGRPTWKRGVADLVDEMSIKHLNIAGDWDGGWSTINLKSYDQGRRIFQGVTRHWAWLDEEAPVAVYDECLPRLMTVDGRVFVTFTPLEGMSELVMSFLDDEQAVELGKLDAG